MSHTRLLLALAVTALAVACAPAFAQAPKAGIGGGKQSRAALLKAGAIKVKVRTARRGTYRVAVRLQRGRSRTAAAKRTIRVRPGTRRTVRLRLRRPALRRLRGCERLTLVVRVLRGRRTVAVRRSVLAPRRGCARPGGRAPGSTKADPVAPGFDTANAERCDPVDPSVCLQPFPNNHFTTAGASTATGRKLNLKSDSMPKNRAGTPIDPTDMNRSDGFSPGQALITRVPGLDSLEAFRATGAPPIDDPARSLAADSPVVVINTATGKRHLVWAEIDSNPADPTKRNLIIRPAVNFDEGARYVVGLRNLKDKDGKALDAGRAFRVYRDGITTTDPKVEARRAPMERILADLDGAGVKRDELYVAWDFTVASAQGITGRMLSIRDRAFAALGDTNLADRKVAGSSPSVTINPDLPDQLSSAPSPPGPGLPIGPPGPDEIDGVVDYPEGQIARTVRGRITVPCFLDTPSCSTGGRFAIGPDGNPQQLPGNTVAYEFTCNIPRDNPDRPAGKLRPGLYGHGLFGGQGEIFQGQLKALSFEHGFLFCAVDWNGMSTKDLPNTATVLQDLSRFPTLIDHVQQGYLGFLYLGRALLHPEGLTSRPEFNKPVDTSELFYDGNSQGGIYGGSLTAIAPDFERAVLGVPGMNYSTLLRRSVDFDTYAQGDFGTDTEAGLYDNYPSELERPLLLGLIQILWDRGDPNGYAHHMTDDPLPNTPPHKVLLHVGFGDHQVADITTEVQARTIGAGVHRPLLGPGRERFRDRPYPDGPSNPFSGVRSLIDGDDGSGVIFWDIGPPRAEKKGTPAPYAANIPPREGQDPHESPRRTARARVQKSAFLRPGGKIIDVCGGPCFADDYTGTP